MLASFSDHARRKAEATAAPGRNLEGMVGALDRVMAVIEFATDGSIISANGNFEAAMGYSFGEIQGRHHRMFVDPAYAASDVYRHFWEQLNRGEYIAGEFKRVAKGGREIWLQASYNPILDKTGRVTRIVKFATDITAAKAKAMDSEGQLEAINRSQAVIEFKLDGTIINANENFLATLGYRLEDVKGRHHRMFVDPAYAASSEYHQFWESLRRGEYQASEYRRVGAGGKQIWIQASYNPIRNAEGVPVKVVKFATDITAAKNKSMDAEGQLEAINRSQAVIEFKLDGTIINANENFLGAVGYRLEDIKGRHHRMFVEPAYGQSTEYAHFWESLRRGEFQAAEYKRIGAGGRTIWIQASYNPIRDADGKPMKVVKYATDITAMVERRIRNEKLSVEIERDLSGIAENIVSVSRQATDVSAASTEAASTIQNVAAAAEELNASINEISSSVSASKRSVDEAQSLTKSADASTIALTKTAQQMSSIVELIDDIAAQINLLALNATIESARAGEAGRGFAVVAAEVKQLAAQVSSATKTISTEIQGVQSVSADVVSSLKAIQEAVSGISQGISAVAASVQQQSSATSEISSTMQAASGAVASIDQGVSSMAAAMGDASHSTGQVRENMRTLVK